MAKKLDTETQLKVLALIARGDTYSQINKAMGIPVSTIQSLKERNSSALATITEKLVQHTVSSSKELLTKSQGLIKRKLDKAETAEDQRQLLIQELEAGNIGVDEFRARWDSLTDISITELNAVQREAFHQSQVEDGKPTSIAAQADAKDQLLRLADEIRKEGNEIELYKLVLKPGESDHDVLEQV